MKLSWSVMALALLPSAAFAEHEHFRFDQTLRIDLHHSGDAKSERFDIDELRREGLWPGRRDRLVSDTGDGCTLAEIYPAKGDTKKPVFSYGYCSVFGEWQTTDEAKRMQRTFSETVRLPMPLGTVRLQIKTRDKKNRWRQVFSIEIDPSSRQVSSERRRGGLKVRKLHDGGPVELSLDIVILGDGYQAWQLDKFRQDAQRFASVLLATSPFSHTKHAININTVESPSRQSGVDEPRKGIFRDTALSMGFNSLDSSRYLLSSDEKAVRDVAANTTYDAIIIISNTNRYGGGGIYNLYASFSSDNEYDEYTLVHEFGHSLAGLGDEYYDSASGYDDMYPKGMEPWEPNITAVRDRQRLKWRELVDKSTPIPTPNEERFAGKVGLFEGAGYTAKGLFRPALNCKMFDKGNQDFCPVCMRAVRAAILNYTRPNSAGSPPAGHPHDGGRPQ